jgi:hypothetical protein
MAEHLTVQLPYIARRERLSRVLGVARRAWSDSSTAIYSPEAELAELPELRSSSTGRESHPAERGQEAHDRQEG